MILVTSETRANTDFHLTATGIDGTGAGTVGDPFVAATANSYTWVLTNKQPNYTFHYTAGTYLTFGADSGGLRETVGANCIHLGTGQDTIIRLVDDGVASGSRKIFGHDYVVGSADGFELRDMRLECNANALSTFTSTPTNHIGALSVGGNNLVFSNLTIVGFATRGREGFPFTIRDCEQCPQTVFSNITVSGVVFQDPGTNSNDGVTCCSIYSTEWAADGTYLGKIFTNTIVTNCTVRFDRTHFSYVNAFSVPTLVNSVVDGASTAFYHEPNRAFRANYDIDYRAQNNLFTNVAFGVQFAFFQSNSLATVGPITILSNNIYLYRGLHSVGAGISIKGAVGAGTNCTSHVASVVVQYNFVKTNASTTTCHGLEFNPYNGIGLVITNLLASHNTIEVDQKAVSYGSNTALYASIFENRSSSAVLAPIIDSSYGTVSGTQQKGDFNVDTHTDLLWNNTNQTVRSNMVWFMSGTNKIGTNLLVKVVTTDTVGSGIADFTGDCNNDILWRKTVGSNFFWTMTATNWESSTWTQYTNTNWKVGGTGDLNGDGRTDIVWRDSTTGSNVVWIMNGMSLTDVVDLDGVTDLDWTIRGVADFNRDGKNDLFWRNDTTGDNAVWYMNGLQFLGDGIIDWVNPNARANAIGDFNMDGKPDIVWWGTVSLKAILWTMDDTNHVGTVDWGSPPNSDWVIVGPR